MVEPLKPSVVQHNSSSLHSSYSVRLSSFLPRFLPVHLHPLPNSRRPKLLGLYNPKTVTTIVLQYPRYTTEMGKWIRDESTYISAKLVGMGGIRNGRLLATSVVVAPGQVGHSNRARTPPAGRRMAQEC